MTWYPAPTFHTQPTLSKFYIESRNKVHFFAAVVAVRIPYIVIVLDTFFEQALPGALDLHFIH